MMVSTSVVGIGEIFTLALTAAMLAPTSLAFGFYSYNNNNKMKISYCSRRISLIRRVLDSKLELGDSSSSTSEMIPPKKDTKETEINVDLKYETGREKVVRVALEKMGSVDETRITFDELRTGEVNRLYSNLKYEKTDEGELSAIHTPGSTWGAAALVSGTTIGAGVLALPAATAPVGFIPSTGALFVAWAYMVISGLLISELTMNQMGETGKSGAGLLNLYKSFLPKGLSNVGSAAYFFLHYAVMVAFFAQGGNNLEAFVTNCVGESSGRIISRLPGIGQVLFAGTVGVSLYVGSRETIEKVNNGLVIAVFASLIAIIGIGSDSVDVSQLLAPDNQHPELVVSAFPILFLSLVYHNIVPTIVAQLEGNRKKITTALVTGTLAPLLLFIAWNAVILGTVFNASDGSITDGVVSGALDPIKLLQTGGHGGPVLSALVGGFSEVAIVTSLIGFVYSLVGEFRNIGGLPAQGPKFEEWKPVLYAAIFLPPLFFSVANPGVFFDALDYGGAFGVSTLFLVLPPIMVWNLRYGDTDRPLTALPMVPGGKVTLGSLWKIAGTLILEQGADKLGVLTWIHDNFFKDAM